MPQDPGREGDRKTQQVQRITGSDFDQQIRQLIDIAYQSGVQPKQIEEILTRHADGAEYYHEDLLRYNPRLGQQQ